MRKIAQNVILQTLYPLAQREIWGWGQLFKIAFGTVKSNSFWTDAGLRRTVGKLHGYEMELDISFWSERMAYLLGRWYDLPTQKLLKVVLTQGDTVVDVGGNIGMFSLAAHAAIGEQGKIYAFEPNPAPRKKFERHIELNRLTNIALEPVALSHEEGEFMLNYPKVNSGEGSLSTLNYADDDTHSVMVSVKIGDQMLAKVNPRLVKIDVEGAEIAVIKGLRRLIARSKPVIIAEYIPEHLSRFGVSINNFLALAEEAEYRIFYYTITGPRASRILSLRPIFSEHDAKNLTGDFVMAHQDDPFLAKYS